MTYKPPDWLELKVARPYGFRFPLATTALIIIDVQRDFVDPGGFGSIQCGNDEVFATARAIVPDILKVLKVFRSAGAHVIHTREGQQPDLTDLPAAKRLRQISAPHGHHPMGIGDKGPMGRLLVRGEYGHDIVDELTPWPDELVIDKPGKGSFFGTNFHRALLARGITHLLFTGVTTECCVTTTLRECNDRGYECCILEDCTQGFDAQQVKTSLDIVAAQDGLFGYVSKSNEVIKATESTLASLANRPPSVTPSPNTKLPSMAELRQLYRSGAIAPDQVVNIAFDLIDAYQKADPGVWISLESRENCIEAARKLADKYADRPLPPLYGLPFSVKDTIDVAGFETTAACPEYAYTPATHAMTVQLVLDAGGIYVGKTNLDQLATGLSGCRSPYGVPHSTFSDCHISGGSTSGGAVSVGAGLVSFSLATDTAGSGRIPAAFNGVVGFKPTKGTVSAKGLVPACKTLDGITVMAQTVPEARAVWQVIAQYDRDDPYSKPPHTLPTWAIDFRGVQRGGFTFAIPPATSLEVCTPAYRALFSQAVGMLEKCGGALREIDYVIFERAGELLYNGALLHERITCIGQDFLESNMDRLHPVIKQLFSQAFVKAPSAYDVFRDQALQVELTRLAQQTLDTLNGGVDVLVVPTTVCHPTTDEVYADPIALNSRLGTFTHYANVVDLCGINVPAGTYTDEHGTLLPFGITILGGSGFDAKILDVAGVFQASMDAQASLNGNEPSYS